MQEDLAQVMDLQSLAAYEGERPATHGVMAMLDMVRCPGCGLWQHQWNASGGGLCLSCESRSA